MCALPQNGQGVFLYMFYGIKGLAMNLDFLTPEFFDMLVIANLIVALLLIGFRFYQDMTHINRQNQEQREQTYDESSYDYLAETDRPSPHLSQETKQNQQQSTTAKD